MIGLIARWGSMVVVTTGASQEEAEQIALTLFRRNGIDLDGVEVTIIVFDPMKSGGLLMEPEDQGSWSEDGWTASEA